MRRFVAFTPTPPAAMRAACLLLAVTGCTGYVDDAPSPAGGHRGLPANGAGGGPAENPGKGGEGGAATPADPGRVTMRQLNRVEYDNTVRDLLGTTQRPGLTFLNDAPAFAFDNNADHLSISPAQAGLFQKAAESLAAEALTGPARSRLVTCDLAAAGDACPRAIVTAFGARAYRRPLSGTEIAGYLGLMTRARAAGATADETLQTALEAFLLSPSFLYRIEADPAPDSLAPHRIGPYELASRLSYLVYRSMPDQALFEAAAAGKLAAQNDIQAQLARLLADPKGHTFAKDFVAQWLGVVGLDGLQFDSKAFPTFTTPLAAAMKSEITAVFDAFVRENLPVAQLLTPGFSYLDSTLASHYGVAPVPAGDVRRVDLSSAQRGGGLLTMAGTLAVTSYMTRTSLVKRGAWVSGQLLCSEPPPPPADIPALPENGMVMGTQRQILEMHRANPSCAPCHEVIDNIGIALENYDAIGAWRDRDANGGLIDASGELKGTRFTGGHELAKVIAVDPRFPACLAEKMLAYALGRDVNAHGSDAHYVKEIAADGPGAERVGVQDVLRRVVASEAFTMRRGEKP